MGRLLSTQLVKKLLLSVLQSTSGKLGAVMVEVGCLLLLQEAGLEAGLLLQVEQRVLEHVLLLDDKVKLQLLRLLTRRLWLEDGVGRFLYCIVDDDNTSLRVDGFDVLWVVCSLTVEQQVRKHVAMIANEEGVRHEGQFL